MTSAFPKMESFFNTSMSLVEPDVSRASDVILMIWLMETLGNAEISMGAFMFKVVEVVPVVAVVVVEFDNFDGVLEEEDLGVPARDFAFLAARAEGVLIVDSRDSIACLQTSNALRTSPVPATRRAASSTAFGCINGKLLPGNPPVLDEGVLGLPLPPFSVSSGTNDNKRSLIILAISSTEYGLKLICFGSQPRVFKRGKNRSVKSRAFAIPTRTNREEASVGHSNNRYKVS